ncbi:MAG TPA: thiamine phosphate synthase [Acidimicrobiales bacterium]|nr:thiamine phosphate synthase [Acidimicrobiales bacterium]
MSAPGAAPITARRLYLCTPDRPDLASFIEACILGGVDVVQLRDKSLTARAVVDRARVAKRVCGDHGVPFIVNDRPDLALDAGADGVHLGQDDASSSLARRILGAGAIVGLSTHAPHELEASRREPVDYISAGPVAPTPTKPGRPGTGVAYVTAAVADAGRPVFVTGGVTPETVPGLAAAGARHFVVVRFLTEAPDPRRAASSLRAAIDEQLSGRR